MTNAEDQVLKDIGCNNTNREEQTLPERLAGLRRRHPLPRLTGLAADKAFFDRLSGDAKDGDAP